jgi:hypothetical protein
MPTKSIRPINSYVNSAKGNSELIPSLKKYRRRKKLNRWEKSAITRAANKLKALRSVNLVPVTKKQAKLLGKKIVVGGGIRAIELDGFGRDSKLTIKDGKPVIKSRTRGVVLVPTEAALEPMAAALKRAFNQKGNVTVWLWTTRGRTKFPIMSLKIGLAKINELFTVGTSDGVRLSGNPQDFLLGIQYLVENKNG